MATVQNERDVLMRSAAARVVSVTLPSNVVPQDLKGITLSAPALVFKVDGAGLNPSPAAITVTANLKGVPAATSVTWSTSSGTATVTPQGPYSQAAAVSALTTNSVVVTASITVSGLTYQSSISFVKVKDGTSGTDGSDGQRGSLTLSRAITGSAWTDTEAALAVTGAGAAGPMDTDVVTLYNVAAKFSEQRRFNGTSWVAVDASFPGSTILPGTVVVEKLLVAGSGIALNADPNCVDITAWTGSGLTVVADTSAPNGSSALRCTANGVELLSRKFAIDPTKAYRTRMSVKQESGTSTCYLLVAFYDASGTVISGSSTPANWTDVGGYHYFGRVNASPPSSYTEYAVSFGQGEVFGIPSNARYASIGMLPNYSGTGVQRLSGSICHLKTTGDMLVDGTVTANLIDSKGLSIKDAAGNVVISGGASGGAISARVSLNVADAIFVGTDPNNGVYLGSGGLIAKKSGVTTLSVGVDGTAQFSGALNAATGTFAGALVAATGTFAGSLSAATGTFSGTLTAAAVNAVNEVNIAGDAVIVPRRGAAYIPEDSVGYGTRTAFSLPSMPFNSAGRVLFFVRWNMTSIWGGRARIYVLRDATTVVYDTGYLDSTGDGSTAASGPPITQPMVTFEDPVSAGTHTYTCYFDNPTNRQGVSIYCELTALAIKKA